MRATSLSLLCLVGAVILLVTHPVLGGACETAPQRDIPTSAAAIDGAFRITIDSTVEGTVVFEVSEEATEVTADISVSAERADDAALVTAMLEGQDGAYVLTVRCDDPPVGDDDDDSTGDDDDSTGDDDDDSIGDDDDDSTGDDDDDSTGDDDDSTGDDDDSTGDDDDDTTGDDDDDTTGDDDDTTGDDDDTTGDDDDDDDDSISASASWSPRVAISASLALLLFAGFGTNTNMRLVLVVAALSLVAPMAVAKVETSCTTVEIVVRIPADLAERVTFVETTPQITMESCPDPICRSESESESQSQSPECVPDCTNKECGSDGCQGTCGPFGGGCDVEGDTCSESGVCGADVPGIGFMSRRIRLDIVFRDVHTQDGEGFQRHPDFEMSDFCSCSGDCCPVSEWIGPENCFCTSPNDNCNYDRFDGVGQGQVEPTIGDDGTPVYRNNVLNAVTPAGDPSEFTSHSIHNADTFYSWYHDDPNAVCSRYPNVRIDQELVLQREGESDAYVYDSGQIGFFPLDNLGFGAEDASEHNFGFTTAIDTTFTFSGDERFTFSGDDDVWVFIDGKLVLDIGGLHPPRCRTMDLSTVVSDGFVTVTGGVVEDSVCNDGALNTSENVPLTLVAGQDYSLQVFHAERHTFGSNFRIETTLRLRSAA